MMGVSPALSLVLSLTVLSVLPAVSSLGLTDYIVASRCQAKCISKYLPLAPTDQACAEKAECLSCWRVCETLIHTDQPVPCDMNDCSDGCETACHFMYTSPKAESAPDNALWTFPSNPTVTTEGPELLVVDWSPVTRTHSLRGVQPVYLLLWSDVHNPDWEPVYTTTEKWAEVEGPHYQYEGLVFNLLAITESGVVAEALPAFPADGPFQKSQATLDRSNKPRIAVQVSVQEGSVHSLVRWQSQEALPRIELRWGRVSCRTDPSLPQCELDTPQFHTQVELPAEDSSYLLKDLTYNSRYWVEVTIAAGETLREYFNTPWCHQTLQGQTRCGETPTTFRAGLTDKSEGSGLALPLYAVIAICVTLAVLLALTLWFLVRRQRAITLLSAKTKFACERVTSFRSSVSGSLRRLSPRLKASFRRFSQVKRGGERNSTRSGWSMETRYTGLAQKVLRSNSDVSECSSKRNPYLDDLPSPPVPPRYTDSNTLPSFSVPSIDHDIYLDIQEIPEYLECRMVEEEDSGLDSKMAASTPDISHTDTDQEEDSMEKVKLFYTLSAP